MHRVQEQPRTTCAQRQPSTLAGVPPPPRRAVPWRDAATNADLGTLVRAAVDIVRREGGYEGDDPDGDVEITVTLRAPRRST